MYTALRCGLYRVWKLNKNDIEIRSGVGGLTKVKHGVKHD